MNNFKVGDFVIFKGDKVMGLTGKRAVNNKIHTFNRSYLTIGKSYKIEKITHEHRSYGVLEVLWIVNDNNEWGGYRIGEYGFYIFDDLKISRKTKLLKIKNGRTI